MAIASGKGEVGNMDEIRLGIGTEVVVDSKQQGVISRIAVDPKHPEDQWWNIFEVTIVGTWRTRKVWYSGHNLKVLR